MNLAPLIDHTFLKPNGSPADIARLCKEARKFGFASVCVHPCEVCRSAKLLKGSKVAVCTVIAFPLGQSAPSVIACEAVQAVEDGATELDFVINVAKLKVAAAKGASSSEAKALAHEYEYAINAAKTVSPAIHTKLILECCYLTRGEKICGCRIAKRAGFDFVKTSTGFGTGGATVEDVKLLRKTVGKAMGVKAAGGIRTKSDAEAMVAAGATRLGCSCGVALVSGKSQPTHC